MPKRKSLSAFNKFTWLLLSIVLVFSMSSVHAAVDIDRTRIVINANDLESDFTLANSGEDNVLLQLWSDKGDLTVSPSDEETPLFVIPPIFKMARGEVRSVRLLLNRADLDFEDRENLLWLNIFQVTQVSEEAITANAQQIMLPLRLRLKVLVRPKGIEAPGKNAYSQLRFVRAGEGLKVVNPLPWFANFLSIKVGDDTHERITIAPFSSVTLPLGQRLNTQQIQFDIIGDDGNTTNYKSTLVN
ncbi:MULTISPECIES: fimbria/pilus periplasmic chaperone [Vibrio]|uniref:fimbria/pilus periplasmic chaperone n=1 Tax=Vibrio TaxID=662 RepID=UPI0003A10F8F|nr:MULTISPECIES: fimbria/pilus periplasmic chaperone [Vibrio]KIP74021.1 fimbrial chaperone protein [Vibrio harveyi]PAW11874.1 fimbrial chaperone protein [Vibrio sp. V1B]